jgi:hypothetical protein
MAGRTILIIAHRRSPVVHTDRIVVLDYGGIVQEDGQAEWLQDLQRAHAALYQRDLLVSIAELQFLKRALPQVRALPNERRGWCLI